MNEIFYCWFLKKFFVSPKKRNIFLVVLNINNISSQTFQTLKELPTPLWHTQCATQTRIPHLWEVMNKDLVILITHSKTNTNNNNKHRNQITLLSFGGSSFTKRHTLVMKYVSVWNNHPIITGRDYDHYEGVRAVIGRSNNHLLFITYYTISVFDLNTFQFIKHNTLPTNDSIFCHCFVSNSKKGQEIMKINKQNYQILLSCESIRCKNDFYIISFKFG
ncbi:hypothetical protein RFI_02443 [Reticulomyxa filosa]|uniref:Uncharacterized protein n=1 Tax=Reticulomyxa filosa TaxID=46433 RepID=X6PAH3_RETFI|nr:hypothetical protein RFI_02443 [Reticulomyxa filosa]|eukprot:ETO34647.1 hypothetical protein RFI_02443 [Reticulomyxa filosa]